MPNEALIRDKKDYSAQNRPYLVKTDQYRDIPEYHTLKPPYNCQKLFRKESGMPLSPAKAATVAGVSRSAISKALAAGQLVGFKRNSGHWSITEKDLADWMGNTISRADSTPAGPERHSKRSDPADMVTLREELKAATAAGQEAREGLASAEARLEALGEVIANLKADRDAWQTQAKALAARPGGFFTRIFGR